MPTFSGLLPFVLDQEQLGVGLGLEFLGARLAAQIVTDPQGGVRELGENRCQMHGVDLRRKRLAIRRLRLRALAVSVCPRALGARRITPTAEVAYHSPNRWEAAAGGVKHYIASSCTLSPSHSFDADFPACPEAPSEWYTPCSPASPERRGTHAEPSVHQGLPVQEVAAAPLPAGPGDPARP